MLGHSLLGPGGMRACPAGNGKGACACSFGQVSNIRLWPSPRVDIGATMKAKAQGVAHPRDAYDVAEQFRLEPYF